jgi:hypothetical protein
MTKAKWAIVESQMGNCEGDLVQHAADDAAARVELEDTGRRLTLS